NPNASVLALAPFTKNIGSAAAMLGCSQIGIAALASIGVGMFDTVSILPMIALMVGTAFAALIIFIAGEKKMNGEIVAADAGNTTVIH
ncbi:MAG TPA: hypothetical protein VK796_01815, partial [Cytophaga sp.]|nr:hypothetical protein [Cytophaga sp.]